MLDQGGTMFRWNMSLETGIAPVDQGRRVLIEAMADFFQIIDNPALNQKMVAERTGAIYTAMKTAFTAEDEFLKAQTTDTTSHQATHAAFLLAYVEMCKKLVPKIKMLKQAQQACLEIYRLIDTGVYRHVSEEVLPYKHMRQKPMAKSA